MPRTKVRPEVDLHKLGLEELDDLISQASTLRKMMATPRPLITGYVDSFEKHIKGALQAAHKLADAHGVSPDQWERVFAQAEKLQRQRLVAEARKVPVRYRDKAHRQAA